MRGGFLQFPSTKSLEVRIEDHIEDCGRTVGCFWRDHWRIFERSLKDLRRVFGGSWEDHKRIVGGL